ncbi:MAG: hypothetical protein SF052_25065 [Bacteroidia bacterium]|nr:hypothetical protein [Bacteroidia bacterium]
MRYITLLLILVSLPFSGMYAGISFEKYLNTDIKFSLENKLSIGNTAIQSRLTDEGLTWGDDDYYYDYDDDDFYYSRRLRRFHSSRSVRVSWNYYDPYFTSDIYFVIGTPYWDIWCARYDPWSLRRSYVVQTNWFWGPVVVTNNVYATGWNPWGYDPFFYNDCAYGGGFYNYSYTNYNYYGSSWGYNRGYNRGYNKGYNRGYRNGYRNGYNNGYANGYNQGFYSGGGYSNDYWYRRSSNGNSGTRYARSTSNYDRNDIRDNARQRESNTGGRTPGGYNGEDREGQYSPRNASSGTSGRLAAPSTTSGRASTINRDPRTGSSGGTNSGRPQYVTPGYERENGSYRTPSTNSNIERRTYSTPERSNTYSTPRPNTNSNSNIERRTYSTPERSNTYSTPRPNTNSNSNIERRTYSTPERSNTYSTPRPNTNSNSNVERRTYSTPERSNTYSTPRPNTNSNSNIERRTYSTPERSNTYSTPRPNTNSNSNVERRTYSTPERSNTYSTPRPNTNSNSNVERRSAPTPPARTNTYSAPQRNTGSSGSNISRPSSGSNNNSRTASPSTIRRGN